MLAVKRPAEEELFRNPKQPRTKMTRQDGAVASPSEREGIRSSFARLVRGLSVILSGEKVSESAPVTIVSNQESTMSGSSATSTSPIVTPRQTPGPEVNVASTEGDLFHDLQIRRLSEFSSERKSTPPSSRPSLFAETPQSSRVASSSSHDFLARSSKEPFNLESDALQSTPKPRHDVFSSNSLDRAKEVIDPSSTKSPFMNFDFFTSPLSEPRSTPPKLTTRSSKLKSKANPSSRRHRPHIYAERHKMNVKKSLLEERKKLQQEIYEIHRKRGFASSFADFQGLLDFERELVNLKLKNAPQRHNHSLALPKLPVVPTVSEDAFLQNALHKARATLGEPKPKTPFSATFDQLQIAHRSKDEAIAKRLRPPLPSAMPEKDEQEVIAIQKKPGQVSKFAREAVDHNDIARLSPSTWLNDEIINFYGALILARSEAAQKDPSSKGKGKAPLNVHYLSSFFWEKMTKAGYAKGRLNKWTKKLDIFEKDALLIPVNHYNHHWTAASINFRKKRFESYDSLKSYSAGVFPVLRRYIDEEHLDKKKKPFDFDGWIDWAPDDVPQQENGYDCGVFTMHFLEALSRGEEMFSFTQKDMPYLRRRMIWEIGNAQLRGGHYA